MFPFPRRTPTTLTPQQAMAARPLRVGGIELVPTVDGGRLKVPMQSTRLLGRVFKLPPGASKTFELDAIGLAVWNACDGRTTVRQIIKQLASQYRVSDREMQVSTVRFLHTLTKKGLVGIAAQRQKDEGEG